MPAEYRPAEPETMEELSVVLSRHQRFQPLIDCGLRFDVLMAFSDKPHAVKRHGAPCVAKIKAIGPEERARARKRSPSDVVTTGDVRIILDGGKYAKRTESARHAVLAHELYHIKLQERKEGGLKRDVYGRPVVKLIPDDWEINGFLEVFQWYGDDSQEHRSYAAVREILSQGSLQFMLQVTEDLTDGAWTEDAPLDLPADTTLSVNGKPIQTERELVDALFTPPPAPEFRPDLDPLDDDEPAADSGFTCYPPPEAKAPDYGLNEHEVFTRPEELVIPLAPSTKCKASVLVAEGADGRWYAASHFVMPMSRGGGHSALPSVERGPFGTRADAIKDEASFILHRLQAHGYSKAVEGLNRWLEGLGLIEPPRHPTRDELRAADPEHSAALVKAFGIKLDNAVTEDVAQRTLDMLVRGAFRDLVPMDVCAPMQKGGASDAQIRDELVHLWGYPTDRNEPKTQNGYTTRGGARPAFWVGDTAPEEGSQARFRRPDSEGPALIARVRKVMAIGEPAPAVRERAAAKVKPKPREPKPPKPEPQDGVFPVWVGGRVKPEYAVKAPSLLEATYFIKRYHPKARTRADEGDVKRLGLPVVEYAGKPPVPAKAGKGGGGNG